MNAARPRHFYLLASLLLLAAEVLIALFAHDRFIRPFVGDALVAILLYCLVQLAIRKAPQPVALAVLAFCCVAELLQATPLLQWTGAGKSRLLRILLGSTFDPVDILAYAVGIAAVLVFEKQKKTNPRFLGSTKE